MAATAFVALFTISAAEGQTATGFYRGTATNPSLAGASGDGVLRMSYLSLFPGSGFKLNNFHVTFDRFYEALHGGAGVSFTSEQAGGLLNDTRMSFSYSYHLRAARDLYILAGMSSGFIFRGFNRSDLLFPDQIDPLLGPVLQGSETVSSQSRFLYDMGAGFTFVYKNSMASVDAGHLFSPDLSGAGIQGAKLPVRITIQAFSRIATGAEGLSFVPYGEFTSAGYFKRFSAGTALEYQNLGAGLLWQNTPAGSALQPSLTIRTGRLALHYSVMFSASPGNQALAPVSMHRAGITTGLNIVDKRKTVMTIILPHL